MRAACPTGGVSGGQHASRRGFQRARWTPGSLGSTWVPVLYPFPLRRGVTVPSGMLCGRSGVCRASQALGQRATRLFPQQGVLRPVVLYGGLSWVLRKVEQYSWPFPLNVRGTLSMTTTDRPSVPRGRVPPALGVQRIAEEPGGLRWPGKGPCPMGPFSLLGPRPRDTCLTPVSLGGIRTWTLRVHRSTGLQPM